MKKSRDTKLAWHTITARKTLSRHLKVLSQHKVLRTPNVVVYTIAALAASIASQTLAIPALALHGRRW